jgi:hypothetical protein
LSKHASARPETRAKQLGQAKVIGTVVLVVAFVVLFVGGAVGLIGTPDKTPVDLSGVPVQGTGSGSVAKMGKPSASSTDASAPTATDSSAPAATDPGAASSTPVSSGVPPQVVVSDGAKLKRTLEWLRRGLADETSFRVASLNLLGSSHTAQGGNRKGWASGTTRAGWAWSLLQQADVDVVGFQEMEDPQYARIASLSGWSSFPGPGVLDRGSIRDSIFWDPAKWELVEANSVAIPYFGGQMIRRPVVKLKNVESEREVWFFNTHNPATTPSHGNNARWRASAISIETQLANELSADGTPVVFTGDYNDRAETFCPLVGNTDLEAANGGSNDGSCAPPSSMDVDWIFGAGVDWQNFYKATQGITGKITDHPFIYADAYIAEEPIPGGTPGASPSASPSSSESADSE